MTTMQGSSGRVLGSLAAVEGKGAVRIEDRFDTDPADLWSALTEPDRLARWIGEVEGDLRTGGEFRARFVTSGWEGTGRVEACAPPHHFRVRTVDAEDPDPHTIEVTLTADGDTTVLVVEERGMPLDQLPAYGAGVQIHVEDLAAYLAGRQRRDTKDRWVELLPAYRSLVPER